MKQVKKIWKGERFYLSASLLLYEKLMVGTVVTYRKLQPVFENRFWEVYALHRENGLYYAVIGKHHNVRVFYKKEIILSHAGCFWMPIGRDLAVKAMGDDHWDILACENGHLVQTTNQFLPFRNCLITSIEYQSPILSLVAKMPVGLQYECKVYWKQTPKGYEQLEQKDVEQLIIGCAMLPEDPFFI